MPRTPRLFDVLPTGPRPRRVRRRALSPPRRSTRPTDQLTAVAVARHRRLDADLDERLERERG